MIITGAALGFQLLMMRCLVRQHLIQELLRLNEKGGAIEVSMRYSVTYPFEEKMTEVQAHMAETPFILRCCRRFEAPLCK